MRETLSEAIEDYLKVIYDLNLKAGRASTNEIAARMKVSAASVTSMLKRLSDTNPPLIDYQKHRGAVLTEAGEKVALEVIRHHRLLEMFLHQILGYEWDEVHAEADRLEHVISEQFEERIASVLGHPVHDPHGDPIPSPELTMPAEAYSRLYDLRTGQRGVVRQIRDTNPEMLRYLGEIGLVPRASLVVLDVSPIDENTRLRVEEGEPVVVGPALSRRIFVEVLS